MNFKELTQVPGEEISTVRQMLKDSSKMKKDFKLDFCPAVAIVRQVTFYLETVEKKEIAAVQHQQKIDERFVLLKNLNTIREQNDLPFPTSYQHHFYL